MRFPTYLKYFFSLVLTVVLLYLVFKDISLSELMARVSQVSYQWIFLSVLLAIVSHWLRAYRWNLMLRPFGYKLTTYRTFLAVMSGYLANLALPRLGEITRCGILKKTDGVSMSTAIGTVVVERLLDFLILVSLVALDFILEFDKIYVYFLQSVGWESIGANSGKIYLALGILATLGVMGILILRSLLARDFAHPVLKKLNEKLQELVKGFLSIRHVESFTGFVLSTVAIWVAYFLMSYVIFYSMPETSGLGFGAGLSILAAAGVAMAMPVQGGIGAYHALVSGVLVIYGVEATTGLFFATLLHTSQVLFVILVGGASMVISSFISGKKPTESVPNS